VERQAAKTIPVNKTETLTPDKRGSLFLHKQQDPEPKFPFKIKDDFMDQIYEHNKDEDGLLHITFSDMEVYGIWI
jgi:hypothetical protein